MKKFFVAVTLVLASACGNGANNDQTSDSTTNTSSGGISDGANTITDDTAHMDTSLGHIQTDSAR
jgi:hypothetical protein